MSDTTRVLDVPARLRANIRALFKVLAVRESTCKACGAAIFFVKTPAEKWLPYTADALPHFADCPKADDFRRR